MEKNKNSLILSMLGGVGAAFLCVGLVLIFTSGKTSNLKGDNNSSPNQIVDTDNEPDDEILLGDTCNTVYGTWKLKDDYGDYISGTCTTTSDPTSSTTGTSYVQCSDNQSPGSSVCGANIAYGCHKSRTWTRTSSVVCTSCDANKYLEDGQCKACPGDSKSPAGSEDSRSCKVTCTAGNYLPGQANTCSKCTKGYYCEGGTWSIGDSSPNGISKCPDGMSSSAGSDADSDCVCPVAQYRSSNTCVSCPIGMVRKTSTACTGSQSDCCKTAATCWHENSDKTGCTSDFYSTCDNDPELYSSEIACRSALGLSSSPSPSPTADTNVCCYTHGSYSSMPSVACTAAGGTPAAAKNCEGTSPSPTPTPLTCSNGLTMSNGQSCTIPSGKKCKMYGMGSYSTSGSISCAVSSCEIECATDDISVKINCPTIKVGATGTCSISGGSTIQGGLSIADTSIAANGSGTLDIIGKKAGTTTVTASVEGKTATGTITVVDVAKPITKITISCPSEMTVGGESSSRACTATVTPSDTDEAIVWSSSNNDVANIGASTGVVYAKVAGTTTITAKSETGSVTSNSASVKVKLPADCKISVTKVDNWSHMSLGEELQVSFAIVGTNCSTSVSVTTNGFSGPSSVTGRDTAKYKSTRGDCKPGTVTGCITGTDICQTVTVNALDQEWKQTTPKKNQSSILSPNKAGANEAGKCRAYESCALNSSGKYDCEQWTRCCGTGGGDSNPTPTPGTSPTPTPSGTTYNYCCVNSDKTDYQWFKDQPSKTCPSGYTVDSTRNDSTDCKGVEVPYCYVDDDGEYHWTTSPEASWKKVDSISKEQDCAREETPACYVDLNGNYIWGPYAKKDGYTLITAIDNEDDCKTPTEEYGCYKNADDDYKWATESPGDDYELVDTITDPGKCKKPEEPACYVHGTDFVWGTWEDTKGYIKIEDIETEAECHKPGTDGCYVGSDGKYVWGKYADDPSYKLVASITDKDKCNNDVPVKPTGISISSILYVFMAILMACGIGFIYYSSVIKKGRQ